MTDRKSHILISLGTRPEAIKLAPVILELRRTESLDATVCTTAQHRELLDGALAVFGIVPDIDLDLMTHDQALDALTARVLARTREVIATVEPDLVVVQGDTTSAMASALAAFHSGIPVAHVEAGLRTGHLDDPWPEEANRRLITQLATMHFAPTEHARQNLLREGVDDDRIHVTGNTSIDAVRLTEPRSTDFPDDGVLVTCHRRENYADEFARAAAVIAALAAAQPTRRFVLPLHPNPRVREPLRAALGNLANVELREPFDYPAMLDALRRASFIVTDSGGLQEEAAWFGTPCLVLRRHTDRPESVAAGLAFETRLDPSVALALLTRLHERSEVGAGDGGQGLPYGDGHAAQRIVAVLSKRGSEEP